MKVARKILPIRRGLQLVLVGLLSGVAASGCGNVGPTTAIDPASTNCPGSSAAIQVGDGFFRILCGCTGTGEATGKVFAAPANLTCRLATGGNVVFFYYLGATQRHQILSTGTPQFISSPLSDPSQSSPQTVYGVSFPSTGATYTFQDAFTPMTGQITIQ